MGPTQYKLLFICGLTFCSDAAEAEPTDEGPDVEILMIIWVVVKIMIVWGTLKIGAALQWGSKKVP